MRANDGRRWRWWIVGMLALCGASSCYTSNEEGLGGESHFLRPCERQAQCDDLGPEWSCVLNFCRMSDAPEGAEPGDDDGSGPAPSGAGASGGDGGPDMASNMSLPADSPLVLLLVDTSGSMERLADCACTTAGCEECLPDCARGQRNRFADTLEVLTGTFDDFACEAVDRGGFAEDTYDFGYYLPYHRPSGTQRVDGLMDQYGDRLRFGLATFDGWDTWIGGPPLVARSEFDFELSAGQAGLWSYYPERDIPNFVAEEARAIGTFKYPNVVMPMFMDTGIRSERAASGALALATDPARAGAVNAQIQRSLLAVRPYGGTPIASSLHDVYYVIAQDPRMAGERARGAVPHVVLITDGYPDDDYRTFGCDCSGDSCAALTPDQRAAMSCPYPTPEGVARALLCGRFDSPECPNQVAALHVIGLSTTDATVKERLDAIAVGGGQPGARFANGGAALRTELDAVLADIAR